MTMKKAIFKDGDMDISGNYYIKCLANNKMYPGKALTMFSRKNDHIDNLNAGISEPAELISDWRKYGADNFEWGILRISEASEPECDRDVTNRFWELKYVYEIYPSLGIETYTKKSMHDKLLFEYLRLIHNRLKDWHIVSTQNYVGKSGKGGTKLDTYITDDRGGYHCFDMHDPNEEPYPGKSINTYTKHKQYCEEKNIKFLNLVEVTDHAVCKVKISGFTEKKSEYPEGWDVD